jgi:hypothetical protein
MDRPFRAQFHVGFVTQGTALGWYVSPLSGLEKWSVWLWEMNSSRDTLKSNAFKISIPATRFLILEGSR